MESLRITKKHHRHLNSPFTLPPRTLPFLQGNLHLEPTSALLSTGVFPIGQDFQLTWSSKNGGCLSISHRSQPAKSIWSTVPGQAFVSAAMAETEVEESRGSFLVKDRKVHLLCDHQTVEGISKIDNLHGLFQANEHDFPSGLLELDQNDVKDMKFPVLVISGRIFSKNKKRLQDFSARRSGHIQEKKASISVTNIHPLCSDLGSYTSVNELQIANPTELIEQFTENIGRPPELPEWIISGAVIGMQGGTDKVYNVWNELKAYDIPISAFWLQVPGPVFFMRAGFRDSPKWAMLFWEGDQMVSWQANDGIKSSVVGLLSSGLSGYAFNHSDIGGYCAVSFPLIKYHRSEELLLRWMELNSLTTGFLLWISQEAACKGLPVCRHMFLHYPNDETVQGFTYQQFLVGTEILVVPVLDKGRNTVKAYFPKGESCPWKHIWTGNLYANQEAWVEAPIGYPAVFVKVGSTVGETFLKNLRDLKIL